MEHKELKLTAQEARTLYHLVSAGITKYFEFNPLYSDNCQTLTNILSKLESLARWSNEQLEKSDEEQQATLSDTLLTTNSKEIK